MCHGRLRHIQVLSKGRSLKFLQKKLKFSWIKKKNVNRIFHSTNSIISSKKKADLKRKWSNLIYLPFLFVNIFYYDINTFFFLIMYIWALYI